MFDGEEVTKMKMKGVNWCKWVEFEKKIIPQEIFKLLSFH